MFWNRKKQTEHVADENFVRYCKEAIDDIYCLISHIKSNIKSIRKNQNKEKKNAISKR